MKIRGGGRRDGSCPFLSAFGCLWRGLVDVLWPGSDSSKASDPVAGLSFCLVSSPISLFTPADVKDKGMRSSA